MIRDMPAPLDLAALIDDWIDATMGSEPKPWGTTWSALIRWPGWRSRNGYVRGTTYHHRGVRLFSALGSVKHGPWPRVERPSRAGTA